MEKIIQGKTFVVGDDVDTDQIIPAAYLVYDLGDEEERKLYGRYALSGLPGQEIPFVEEGRHRTEFTIVIAGRNFGCGSSREHAPVALNMAGVSCVVAASYARIFYRNAVDGGYLLPLETNQSIQLFVETGDEIRIDLSQQEIFNVSKNQRFSLKPLDQVADIVASGGIFSYALNEEIHEETSRSAAGRRNRTRSVSPSGESAERCWYPCGFDL